MSFTFGSPKTTTSFTLPATTTSSTTNVTPDTPSIGFNFASGDSKTTPVATGELKLPTFNVGGTTSTGFQLSGTPDLSFGGLPPPSAAGTTKTGFSLGSTLSSSITTTTAPTLNFNLGNNASATATATTSATGFALGTGSSGFSLGLNKTTTSAIAPTTTTTTTTTTIASATTTIATTTISAASIATTTASAIPSGFTFAQLEEALNKWTLEMEEQSKMFLNQALQLNAWDRLVLANGEKIILLNNGIEKVKQQQQQLDHELDFVLAQQRELEECILPLAKELKDIPITDQARNHTYQVADNMDAQLKQMSEDLKEIIERLNESNKAEDLNDPVCQIGRILNAHMNSLQWIDQNTTQISTYLDQITKMHEAHRRNNERSFQLTYE